MAVQDKFRFNVVASRNVRIAYQKSTIITDLRVSNPIVRPDLPSSIDDLYPVLKGCIRDISKIHSKVANITGKTSADIVYRDCLLGGLVLIIRRSNDDAVVRSGVQMGIIDIGIKIAWRNQAVSGFSPAQVDFGAAVKGISERRNSNTTGDLAQNINPLLRNP